MHLVAILMKVVMTTSFESSFIVPFICFLRPSCLTLLSDGVNSGSLPVCAQVDGVNEKLGTSTREAARSKTL